MGDFRDGFPLADLVEGKPVVGTVGEDEVILVRRGDEFFAVSAFCTHYHGPLAEGLVVGDTVRCPWHHACFSLRTGEAAARARRSIRSPAGGWSGTATRSSCARSSPRRPRRRAGALGKAPDSVVIVGGGAAGLAAADMLRREGYDGPLTMISADDSPPCDRPNLSKDYLAGTAQEDWIPLRAPEFYAERHIDLVLNARVSVARPAPRASSCSRRRQPRLSARCCATGAEPVRLRHSGCRDAIRCYYLRTFADSRAIVAQAASAKRVVVVGASFIGARGGGIAARARHRGARGGAGAACRSSE